jgi:hypothetical protein
MIDIDQHFNVSNVLTPSIVRAMIGQHLPDYTAQFIRKQSSAGIFVFHHVHIRSRDHLREFTNAWRLLKRPYTP